MMEEELDYVAVTFRTNGFSAHEKPNELDTVYDEVKAGEQASDTNPVIPENKKKAPLYSLLHLMAAGLGIMCIILVSVVIALTTQLNTTRSEQYNLTAQNLQLGAEKADLERLTEELTRERDRLSWTIGVILEYDNFPVKNHCPQGVCKPCLDGWVLFQSKCYLFHESNYSSGWRVWKESQEICRQSNADLVVIESQQEQKFINKQTKYYHDEKHGYWIGLRKKDMNPWMWVDGNNVTVMYWRTAQALHSESCALTQLSSANPLANWVKVACSMKNRWICETKALIKE